MTRPHFLRYMNLMDLLAVLRGAAIMLLAIGFGLLAVWVGWIR